MRNQENLASDSERRNSFKRAAKSQKQTKRHPSPITLRLTDEERAMLKDLAAGMSVSAYIRKCVFGNDTAPRKVRSRVPVKDELALARVLGMLGQSRIANNLNQIAYHANAGSLLIDEQCTKEIHEAYGHIVSMRGDLINALGLTESA